MKRAQLVIGQSHVAAVRAAAKIRRAIDPEALRTRVVHTLEQRWAPETVGEDFGQALVDGIRHQIARHDPIVASVIGGNGHNALALLRHPRGFDIHLDIEGGPPVDPGAEAVPVALVEAALREAMAPDLARMRKLRDVVGSFVQIESPPPVRDNAFILDHADAYFVAQRVAARGIAPAALRYRMWRLASALVADEAARLGCRYLEVPRATCDADGFLREALAADATHGNADYGALVIEALDGL